MLETSRFRFFITGSSAKVFPFCGCKASPVFVFCRSNWLKDYQFLKKICGRMKREKLKRMIQRHFLNCSTGIEPKNQSNMSSSPRFLHIILRSLRLQAAHSHLSLPASPDRFCSAERKTVPQYHFTLSTTTLKVNKKEVSGSPSVFRYWHTLALTSDLKYACILFITGACSFI